MIPINSLTLRYGIGCFETIKVYEDGSIAFLDEHLQRLAFGAKICRLQLTSPEELRQEVQVFCNKNFQPNLRVLRIIVSNEEGVNSFIEDYFDNLSPLKLTISKVWRIDSESPLNTFKSFNYLKNHLAWLKAHEEGFDDAVLLNEKKQIVESTRSNLFFQKKDRSWITPTIESGCLPGIVRRHLMGFLGAKEESISEKDLSDFEACFATNSLIEARNIQRIDNYQFKELDLSEIRTYLRNISKS